MGTHSLDHIPAGVGEAVNEALAHVLDGDLIETRHGKSWREVLHYDTGMASPRARVYCPGVGRFNVVTAVARFIWMMAGSQSVSAVSFYDSRAANYSPDGLALIGSDYGHRLRRGAPGVDQVVGVIDRLRNDPESRQAATVIWDPMDAVREPIDVPCAISTLYHLRTDGLIATTLMRSNKPLTLMPFNFFEFSMLAETVAAELEVPLHAYRHWVGALQLPQPDVPRAESTLRAPASSIAMPPMPASPSPLAQLTELAKLEEELRAARSEAALHEGGDRAGELLHPYWQDFYSVLAVRWYEQFGTSEDAQEARDNLPAHFSGVAVGRVAS